MSNKKCDGIFLSRADMFPSCSPEIIENFYMKLKSQISITNDPNEILCIIEKAKEVKKKCQEIPFTKQFVNPASINIINTANEKLQRLSIGTPQIQNKKSEGHLLSFSTGRKRYRAVEEIEKAIDNKKRLQNLWII